MSATRDLIAATLSAADLMDETIPYFHFTEELRELCARAMVVPDMDEVERLVEKFGSLKWSAGCSSGHFDSGAEMMAETEAYEVRTALLDYLRGVLAERDQFRDAAKMVPAASDPDPLHLSRILHELAGAASMCWTPKPSTAVFDSQQAIAFVEQAIAEIRQRMQMVSAAPQPVGEAWHLDESETSLLHQLTSPDDDGDYSPLTLRVGHVREDDGTVKFGLLCEYTDYPEEGATILAERGPAPQPVGEEPCRIEQPTGWRCTRTGGHESCALVREQS